MSPTRLTQEMDGKKEYPKLQRLIDKGVLTQQELDGVILESRETKRCPEEILISRGTPIHEVLLSISEHYGVPFVEYDEEIMAEESTLAPLEMERLKEALWFPWSVSGDQARVIAYRPDDPSLMAEIRRTFQVERIEFFFALPADLIRIIENNYDLNPGFSVAGGRTPLAMVRAFLADRRSAFSCYRTALAKARTGLAFLRTGLSLSTIALVLLRIFSFGYLSVFALALLGIGVAMLADGLKWYLPTRRVGAKRPVFTSTEPTGGTTVLGMLDGEGHPLFVRSAPVPGAKELRSEWNDLTPVMRRRFLASDRTDLAEERTTLAFFRTMMARARTGLAFTRTGVAFCGFGIGLFRHFSAGPWTVFDAVLVGIGLIMALEGFYWYMPGRRAAIEGSESVRMATGKRSIWDFVFPPLHLLREEKNLCGELPVKFFHAPGIWGTTGFSLERTLLADRRNVMARLRTILARSRTGLAFIRTGMSISAVALGLWVYFGTVNHAWGLFYLLLVSAGLLLITDGLLWYLPAEKIKRQFPYCFGDMEIMIPDYGTPGRFWRKVVFHHDVE
jgi:uncharacterized membrane protein YidH (DUF202 family)